MVKIVSGSPRGRGEPRSGGGAALVLAVAVLPKRPNLHCHLPLLCRSFLGRNSRPAFPRFGQSDRDCLFLTSYFLSRAPALKSPSFSLVHCTLYFLGGFFAVLSHVSPFRCFSLLVKYRRVIERPTLTLHATSQFRHS